MSVPIRESGLVPLMAAALVLAMLAMGWRPSQGGTLPSAQAPAVDRIAGGYPDPHTPLVLRAKRGGDLLVADGPNAPWRRIPTDRLQWQPVPDQRQAARVLAVPTALRWKHPLPGLPVAALLRAAEVDDTGRRGAVRLFTVPPIHHGELVLVSIHTPHEGFFAPDSGIYVPGLAQLDPPPPVMKRFLEDPRWWKLPGNFHYRGKAWERPGLLQVMAPDGGDLYNGPVRLRINGQMTRGFPQKALRLLFDEPLAVPLFPDGEGVGANALVLRAAGNDQVKAMMRDAVLQDACAGLPFDVSRSRTAVVYINGAYWGVHHLRQRLDEKEVALRYAVKKKDVAMLELRMRKPLGPAPEVERFRDLVEGARRWNGHDPAWRGKAEAELDIDGFLTYMAAMVVLGNKDWPGDNVKFWRFTGKPGTGKPRDGRWYFTMGDVDLGFGANAPPDEPVMRQVERIASPISELLMALLRAPDLQARFHAIMGDLVDGPLSSARLSALVEERIALMAPEMERHTARWRKPADARAWMAHAQAMLRYARERETHVRAWLAGRTSAP
jgi:hypothetical protein